MHIKVLLGHNASQTAELTSDSLASSLSPAALQVFRDREERGEEIKESLICRGGCSAGEHHWVLRRSPNHQPAP